MAATLSLDTITSSGTNIEIPTGKVLKIADAGALKINNIAITTGAQAVLSKTGTYPIVAGDFTGKSSLMVLVNVSAGTSTETIITLPAAADFGTCAIHVVSTATHGAGNYITIKNSSAVEQYSLYFKGDHCEFISDTTNVFRSGNEHATIFCNVALTADQSLSAGAYKDVWDSATSSNYTVVENYGSGWNSTTSDFIVPFDGLYRFGGHVANHSGGYACGWMLKKNGNALNLMTTGNLSYATFNVNEFYIDLDKNDAIEYWIVNHSGTNAARGNASSTSERCVASAWMVRRS